MLTRSRRSRNSGRSRRIAPATVVHLDDHSGPPQEELTVPWWIIGGLAVVFAILGVVAAGTNTLAIDLEVTERLQTFDGRTARFLGWLGDHLGGTKTVLSFLAIVLGAAALLRSMRDAVFLGIAAILRLLATYLKGVFDSPRPTIDQIDLTRAYESTGFPSGHATTAALLMGTLAFMAARRTDRSWVRWGLVALWVTGIATTAFARIWHGAHWFTDTIGGAIVGLIIVLVAANVSAITMDWRSSGPRTARSQTPAPR